MPLTDVLVRNAKRTGKTCKLSDERGLYLEVSPTGGKWWRLKYRFDGKEKRLALGVYPDVSLKDARERREAARKLLANGVDPGEHRKAQKQTRIDDVSNSFEVIAREWFAKYGTTWAATHSERTMRRLERDIFPWIGNRPVGDIHAPEILTVLRRIEARGAGETAHRALSNCGQVFRYDVNYPPWASTAETWWKVYGTREYLHGGFAWTGFDYRGEPTPYGWPSINSQFGIVDMCGYPKDDFYYYKAWWGAEPVLHLFPHWNWEERLGEPVEVWVHSNLDEVELLLNGKSLGSKKVTPLEHLAWTVKYEPGTLEACGRKDGKVVLTAKRETTGKIAELRMTPDLATINADGADIAVLRVEAFDAQGRAVPTAGDLVQFKVTGAGALLGVGNGDPNCQESDFHEPDKEPKRSLFNGLAQVIVQAGKMPGEILIEAWTEAYPGPKLPVAKAVVATRRVRQVATA